MLIPKDQINTQLTNLVTTTRGSAMAEGLRDALVSRNSATTIQNIPFEK